MSGELSPSAVVRSAVSAALTAVLHRLVERAGEPAARASKATPPDVPHAREAVRACVAAALARVSSAVVLQWPAAAVSHHGDKGISGMDQPSDTRRNEQAHTSLSLPPSQGSPSERGHSYMEPVFHKIESSYDITRTLVSTPATPAAEAVAATSKEAPSNSAVGEGSAQTVVDSAALDANVCASGSEAAIAAEVQTHVGAVLTPVTSLYEVVEPSTNVDASSNHFDGSTTLEVSALNAAVGAVEVHKYVGAVLSRIVSSYEMENSSLEVDSPIHIRDRAATVDLSASTQDSARSVLASASPASEVRDETQDAASDGASVRATATKVSSGAILANGLQQEIGNVRPPTAVEAAARPSEAVRAPTAAEAAARPSEAVRAPTAAEAAARPSEAEDHSLPARAAAPRGPGGGAPAFVSVSRDTRARKEAGQGPSVIVKPSSRSARSPTHVSPSRSRTLHSHVAVEDVSPRSTIVHPKEPLASLTSDRPASSRKQAVRVLDPTLADKQISASTRLAPQAPPRPSPQQSLSRPAPTTGSACVLLAPPPPPPPPPPPDNEPPPAPRPIVASRRELPSWVSDIATAGRFLRRVGFGQYATIAADHRLGLLSLSLMSVTDLQSWLGVSPPKDAVALHEECAKLRILFARRATQREVELSLPDFAPPGEHFEPLSANAPKPRASSACATGRPRAEGLSRPTTAPHGRNGPITVGLTADSGWMVPVRSSQPERSNESGLVIRTRPWTPTRTAKMHGAQGSGQAFLEGEKRRRLSLGTLPEEFLLAPKPPPQRRTHPAPPPAREFREGTMPAGKAPLTPLAPANGTIPPTPPSAPRPSGSVRARPRSARSIDGMRMAYSAQPPGSAMSGRRAPAVVPAIKVSIPVEKPATPLQSTPAPPSRGRSPGSKSARRARRRVRVANRMPDAEAEAEAAKAKAEVEAAADEWERHVDLLRALVPIPVGAAAIAAADELLANGKWIKEVRSEAALLLRGLRECAVDLINKVEMWKHTLRRLYTYFASVPHDELAFFRDGRNYLLGLSSALSFLPAPCAIDPLLLRWFGQQLPWMCTSCSTLQGTPAAQAASTCSSMRPPTTSLPPPPLVRRPSLEFAVDGDAPPPSAEDDRAAKELWDAQVALLREGRLRGVSVDAERLVQLAVRADAAAAEAAADAQAAVRGRGARMPSDTWWWSWRAWQHVLYGSSCYAALLAELPQWLSTERRNDAARAIQKSFLVRRARALRDLAREEEARRKAEDEERSARLLEETTSHLNALVRGRLVRMAGTSIADRLLRGLSVPQILRRQRAARSSAKIERAVQVVQQAARMLLARREQKRMATFKQLMRTRVAECLATAPELASVVESAFLRARHSAAVQYFTYLAVIEAYSTPRMADADEAAAEAALDDRLRQQVATLETAKLRVSETATSVVVRAKEHLAKTRSKEARDGLRAAGALASNSVNPDRTVTNTLDASGRAVQTQGVSRSYDDDSGYDEEPMHLARANLPGSPPAVERHTQVRAVADAAELRAVVAEAAAAVWADCDGSMLLDGGKVDESDGDGFSCTNDSLSACKEAMAVAVVAKADAAYADAVLAAEVHALAVANLKAAVATMMGRKGDALASPTAAQRQHNHNSIRMSERDTLCSVDGAAAPSGIASHLSRRRQKKGATDYLGVLVSPPRSRLARRRLAGGAARAARQDNETIGRRQVPPLDTGLAFPSTALATIDRDAMPALAITLVSGDEAADAAEILSGAVEMASIVEGWEELRLPVGIHGKGRPPLWTTLYRGFGEAAVTVADTRARLQAAIIESARTASEAIALAEVLAAELGSGRAEPHRAAAAELGRRIDAAVTKVAMEVGDIALAAMRVKDIHGGGKGGVAAVAEMTASARSVADAHRAMAVELSPLRASWLRTEGSLRLCAYLLWRERDTERRRLSVERTAALRDMLVLRSAGCLDPRREVRAEMLSLAFVDAALALADRLEATPVQQVFYTVGTLTVRVLEAPPDLNNGKKGAAKALQSQSSRASDFDSTADGTISGELIAVYVSDDPLERAAYARAGALAANLNKFELCGREDRLRVRSASWTTETVEYLSGSRDVPALEVTFEAQQEVEEEANSEELLRQLHEAHASGYLSTLLGVTSSALASCSLELPKVERRDAPSLVELRQDARRHLQLAQHTLNMESARKEEHKAAVRQYELTAGAIRQLRHLSSRTQAVDAMRRSHNHISSTQALFPSSPTDASSPARPHRGSNGPRVSWPSAISKSSDTRVESTDAEAETGDGERGFALTRQRSRELKRASIVAAEAIAEAARRAAAAAEAAAGECNEEASCSAGSDEPCPSSELPGVAITANPEENDADVTTLSLAQVLSARSPEEAMPERLQRAFAEAMRSKAARKAQRMAIAAAEGELWLIHKLQKGAARSWAPLTAQAQAGPQRIDRQWNAGLTGESSPQAPWRSGTPDDLHCQPTAAEAEAESLEEPSLDPALSGSNAGSDDPTRVSQLCYYCASLPWPVRMSHAFYDCPKRRKACVREYPASVMERLRVELRVRREMSAKTLATTEENADQWLEVRSRLLQVAGASRVASATPDALCTPPEPPPPPPRSERTVAATTFARRRNHTTRHMLKLVARRFRHAPNAWAEVKAVALMAPLPRLMPPPPPSSGLTLDERLDAAVPPHVPASLDQRAGSTAELSERSEPARSAAVSHGMAGSLASAVDGSVRRRPITPADVQQVALDCGADLEVPDSKDHHLIPLLVALARMPLPHPWIEVGESDHEMCQGKSASGTAMRFFNPKTGESSRVHPAAAAVQPLIQGTRKRTKHAESRPVIQWVQFASDDGNGVYFYAFGHGGGESARTTEFPKLGLAPSPLPPRTLEPSAAALADAAAAGWAHLDGDELMAEVRRDLWEPITTERAAVLRHSPCPVDELVSAALLVGLDPAVDRELMWLLDFVLTPKLPLGWCIETPVLGEGSEPYYWNALSGAVQWEHPNISIATGAVRRLRSGLAVARAREKELAIKRYRAALAHSVHARALERSLSSGAKSIQPNAEQAAISDEKHTPEGESSTIEPIEGHSELSPTDASPTAAVETFAGWEDSRAEALTPSK